VSDIPSSSDVEDILRRLLQDDHAAWTTLVKDYSGVLIGVAKRTFAAYGYKPVAQDAEDVVSVVWSNVLAHDRRIVRRCLEQGRWLATLYTLVRNRAVDIMRAHRLQTVPYDEVHVPEPEPESDADPGAAEIPPEKLQAAMDTLNARERTLVNLFFLQDKKYSEIAALTGIAQNSIGPTIGRALSKLRAVIRREA
jgi:RNA polymerase sigma factor (sigma-70 family)